MKTSFLRRSFNNLDVIIAASFILISTLLFLKYSNRFPLYNMATKIFPVYLGCLLFLYIKFQKIEFEKVEQEYNNNFKMHIIYIFSIIFFISLAICGYILKNSLYYYPISYTYLRIVMALCLFFSIYYLKRMDYKIYYFILFQIIVFALFIRLSPYAIYPTVFGADVWSHLHLADKISQLGSLDGLIYHLYAYYPIMSLLIAAIKIILNVPLVSSLMYSITLCNAISIIFIGIISLKLFEDKKISLYATFFLAFLGHHVYHSFSLVGVSIGFIIVPLLLFLILKRISDKSLNYAILSILLMLTLILSHPNTCAMTVVMLVLFCLIIFLFDVIYFNRINQTLFSIPLLFTTMLISYWIYITKFLDRVLPNIFENFLFSASGETIVILGKIYEPFSITHIFSKDTMYGILLFFMVFGLLTVFQQSDKYKSAFFLMTSFMFFFAIFGGLIQMGSILPWRWGYYGSIFGMVVFSCGFIEFINLRICRRISFRKIGITFLCIFIILGLGGYGSCPFFGHKLLTDDDSQVRPGMSYPELYTTYFVLEHYKQPKIYSDIEFLGMLNQKYFNTTLKADFADNIANNDYNIDGIFMYRKYMLDAKVYAPTKQSRKFVGDYTPYKILRNPEKDLENNTNADIIYDTNETKCYRLHMSDNFS